MAISTHHTPISHCMGASDIPPQQLDTPTQSPHYHYYTDSIYCNSPNNPAQKQQYPNCCKQQQSIIKQQQQPDYFPAHETLHSSHWLSISPKITMPSTQQLAFIIDLNNILLCWQLQIQPVSSEPTDINMLAHKPANSCPDTIMPPRTAPLLPNTSSYCKTDSIPTSLLTATTADSDQLLQETASQPS